MPSRICVRQGTPHRSFRTLASVPKSFELQVRPSMHVHPCICPHACAPMYLCTYAPTHVHLCTFACAPMHVHRCICTYAPMHPCRVCAHTRSCRPPMHMHLCMCTYAYAPIYLYICTHAEYAHTRGPTGHASWCVRGHLLHHAFAHP